MAAGDAALSAIDLEKTPLLGALAKGGFDFTKRAFFIWLGTVPYLTEEAVEITVRTIGSLPAGGELCRTFK